MPKLLLPARMTSSTYIKAERNRAPSFYKNKEWLTLEWWKPILMRACVNILCQLHEACCTPYNDFFNLQLSCHHVGKNYKAISCRLPHANHHGGMNYSDQVGGFPNLSLLNGEQIIQGHKLSNRGKCFMKANHFYLCGALCNQLHFLWLYFSIGFELSSINPFGINGFLI